MPPAHRSMRLGIARPAVAVAAATALALSAAAPVGAQDAPPSIVVTTPILGSVVTYLAGADADVLVLMPNGADPHEWAPSARQIGELYAADLVVANGLGLEEGLIDALAEAEASGVPVFHATDWIEVREGGFHGAEHADGHAEASAPPDDHADAQESAAPDAHDHAHAAGDPHFWVDPVAMHAVVDGLVATLGAQGIDVTEAGAALGAELDALDAEIAALLAPIPQERRLLVTGHDSMGYFADRYGFRLVGAVIPGLSSQGEVSAGALGALAEQIRTLGIDTIFTEVGTPAAVADAIAEETGAQVVALPGPSIPADGSYLSYLREIGTIVADALS